MKHITSITIAAVVFFLAMPWSAVSASQATPIGSMGGCQEERGLYISDELAKVGPVEDLFGPGEEGKVSVVAVQEAAKNLSYMVVVRNNTSQRVNTVEITGRFTRQGTTTALGVNGYIVPTSIEPGCIGFSFVTLKGSAPKGGAIGVPAFEVTDSGYDGGSDFDDLRIIDASVTGDEVIVAFSVEGDYAYVSYYDSATLCFGTSNTTPVYLTNWLIGGHDLESSLSAGDRTTVSFDGPKNCGTKYLVAVAGA